MTIVRQANTDRYMRCASCRATAVVLLSAERDGVPVTAPYVERHVILEPVAIVDGQYVRGDRVAARPLMTSACARHTQLLTDRLLARVDADQDGK